MSNVLSDKAKKTLLEIFEQNYEDCVSDFEINEQEQILYTEIFNFLGGPSEGLISSMRKLDNPTCVVNKRIQFM